MKESLVGFLSDVVRQVLGGGDRRSEKSTRADTSRCCLLVPPYIDFCYNSTLFDLYFLLLLPGSPSLFLAPMFV